uniref:Metalloendopeptidase n=1 Tax=Parastrongyloides trichosuri TaxID=131310 RepID=A0A0N4Z8G8_PARTI
MTLLSKERINLMLNRQVINILLKVTHQTNKRKRAVVQKNFKWQLPIQYSVSGLLNIFIIQQALAHISLYTCLTFHPQIFHVRDNKGFNYVRTFNCHSTSGPYDEDGNFDNNIQLSTECEHKLGVVQQLTARMLGLQSPHNRPDRNKYVTINETNIKISARHLFEIYNTTYIDTYGLEYDYGSALHFFHNDYSNNYKSVIIPKVKEYLYMMGQQSSLSFADYKLLNMHYCSSKCPKAKSIDCKNGGYQNPNNCGICICPRGYTGILCDQPLRNTFLCGSGVINADANVNMIYMQDIATCSFMITSAVNTTISLTIVESSMEYAMPCYESVGIDIKYKADKSATGLCLCGYHTDVNLVSDDNQILIVYNGKKRENKLIFTYQQQ